MFLSFFFFQIEFISMQNVWMFVKISFEEKKKTYSYFCKKSFDYILNLFFFFSNQWLSPLMNEVLKMPI